LGQNATTDANGGFGLTFTCPTPGTLLLVTASGGHLGATGTSNTAIQLASALGACGSVPASIVINELTSVATAYALDGFAPAAGSAAVRFQGSSTGLSNAFAVETKLANAATGAFSSTGHETNATAVQTQLDTVANAVAACDASGSAASSACTELFTCALANASFTSTGMACANGTSTAVTDGLSAALSVAQNAGLASTAGILDVAKTVTAFTPALTTAPNDWSLAMTYAVTNFGPLAIDGVGNVWVISDTPNTGPPLTLSVVELDATGLVLSTPATGWTTGGIAQLDTTDTTNIAIDAQNNVWVGGSSPNIAEIAADGTGKPPTANGWTVSPGLSATAGVTIDSAGNAWFADGSSGDVYEVGAAGNDLSVGGFAASVCDCTGITADAHGNVWLVGVGSAPGVAFMNSFGAQASHIEPPSPYNGHFSFEAIATDATGNLWITDQPGHGVWELIPSGTSGTWSSTTIFSNNAGGGTVPKGIAIDGAGHKWISNQNPGASSITELSADGATNLSPTTGLGYGSMGGAYSIAIDQSGNVWVGNPGHIFEFIGAGAPTRNPIVSAVTSGNFTP